MNFGGNQGNGYSTRPYVKNAAKKNYGTELTDDDITFANGQVYINGVSAGKPDYISPEGRSYYNSSESMDAALKQALGSGQYKTENQKEYTAATKGMNKRYADLYDNRGKLDSATEAMLRATYGGVGQSGERSVLADGSARNGNNMDSLAMQNRANYKAKLNANLNQALLDAMQLNFDNGRGALSDWSTQNERLGEHNLKEQEQNRLDREQKLNERTTDAELAIKRASTYGGDFGSDAGNSKNPYINSDATFNTFYDNVDFNAKHAELLDKYNRFVAEGNAAGANNLVASINALADAREAKIASNPEKYGRFTDRGSLEKVSYVTAENANQSADYKNTNDKIVSDEKVNIYDIDSNERIEMADIASNELLAKLELEITKEIARLNADTQMALEDKQAELQKFIAELTAGVNMAEINANKYIADLDEGLARDQYEYNKAITDEAIKNGVYWGE